MLWAVRWGLLKRNTTMTKHSLIKAFFCKSVPPRIITSSLPEDTLSFYVYTTKSPPKDAHHQEYKVEKFKGMNKHVIHFFGLLKNFFYFAH